MTTKTSDEEIAACARKALADLNEYCAALRNRGYRVAVGGSVSLPVADDITFAKTVTL